MWNFLQNVWHQGPGMLIDLVDPDLTVSFTHYRPKSLCTYFWSTVGMIVGFPAVFLFVAFVALLVAIVLPVIYLYDRVAEPAWSAHKAKKPQSTSPRQANMLVEFVKAKKGRYCPQIFIVD